VVLGSVPTSLKAEQQLLPVAVSHPIAKRIATWDEYSGRFAAVKSVEVRARVSGFIDEVNFTDGAIVNQGDLLFTIDKRPFELAVEASKAEVARAVAQVSLATADVNRAKPLVNTNVLSERDFEQRMANLDIAQVQLLAAQAAIRTRELDLEWTEVRAPIAGRMSDKKVNEGALVCFEIGVMIARNMAANPRVDIQLESTSRRVDLIEEGIDVAIRVRFPPLEQTETVMRTLGEHSQHIVANPALLMGQSMPLVPADLNSLPTLDFAPVLPKCVWQLHGTDGATVRIAHTLVTDDLAQLLYAVLEGVGVAKLPAMVAREHLAARRLIEYRPRIAVSFTA